VRGVRAVESICQSGHALFYEAPGRAVRPPLLFIVIPWESRGIAECAIRASDRVRIAQRDVSGKEKTARLSSARDRLS
jgi:hypothetical protein